MTFWLPQKVSDETSRYRLQAQPEACVGPADRQFFMGGVAFASAIQALEVHTAKPLAWASIQFLSHGMSGEEVDISIDSVSGGRNIAQASSSLWVGERKLQQVIGAFGEREHAWAHQFSSAPSVAAPLECPLKPSDSFAQPGNLLAQFERRSAGHNDDLGIEYLWIRPIFAAPLSAALLALMADFFLGAHSRTQGGTSLDNTFRMHSLKPSGWVLNAVQLEGVSRGIVHGRIQQFAEDGTLLSTGSQTGLLPR